MILGSKKNSITEIQKVCFKSYKQNFHSTAPILMYSRITAPARGYGMAVGLGWGMKSVYD